MRHNEYETCFWSHSKFSFRLSAIAVHKMQKSRQEVAEYISMGAAPDQASDAVSSRLSRAMVRTRNISTWYKRVKFDVPRPEKAVFGHRLELLRSKRSKLLFLNV